MYSSNSYLVILFSPPSPPPILLGLQFNRVLPKSIKNIHTFLEIDNYLMSLELSMVCLFICMNKVTFFVKLNKTITSWFTSTVMNYFNTFDKTVFLEMRKYLPQIHISDLITLFCSLIEQQSKFFQDPKLFIYFQKDSKIAFVLISSFNFIRLFIKLSFISFQFLFMVFPLRSFINLEYQIYPRYQFQDLQLGLKVDIFSFLELSKS